MILGGVIGAFITFTVIKSMGDLGPARAVLIIVVSQVVVERFLLYFRHRQLMAFSIKELL